MSSLDGEADSCHATAAPHGSECRCGEQKGMGKQLAAAHQLHGLAAAAALRDASHSAEAPLHISMWLAGGRVYLHWLGVLH